MKGEVGKFSKIEEEFNELKESVEMGNKLHTLIELSDLIGACLLYCERELGDNFDNVLEYALGKIEYYEQEGKDGMEK